MASVTPKLFIPITKVDAENRIVYGQMTAEGVDSAGEIWDYEGSLPYFEAWTANAEKSSGGKSKGNLRSMHQPIAAGKLTQFLLDPENRSVEIAAKVVDDGEWKKVEEGVYTGFSQGGRYVKRWKDPDDNTKTRYISDPVEVSLVDLPCLPTATFEYIKADGSTELRKFNIKDEPMYEPTNEEVAARATEMAKAAGTPDKWADHIEAAALALKAEHAPPVETLDPAAEPAAPATPAEGSTVLEDASKAVTTDDSGFVDQETKPKEDNDGESTTTKAADEEDDADMSDEDKKKTKEAKTKKARDSLRQEWRTPDGQHFAKAADAVAHILGDAPPPLSPVEAALKAARGDAPVAEPVLVKFVPTEGLEAAHEAVTEIMGKCLYTAGRSLEVLSQVISLQHSAAWEAEYEQDGSSVPAMFAEAAHRLGEAALAMATEEIAEALAGLKADENGEVLVETIYAGAHPEFVKGILGNEELMKIGARNARKDAERIQKIHDNTVELGADCGDDAEKLAKRAETDPVLKALMDERDTLKKEVVTAVEGIATLGDDMKKMREEMEALRQTPAPMAPRTQVVGKGDETPEVTKDKAEAVIGELMKTEVGRSQLADAAIRAAQSAGVVR
jgi:hypothetical protein